MYYIAHMHSITLHLHGKIMPKQSVRFRTDGGRTISYQPYKYKKKMHDYVLQIRSQLPKGFKRFNKYAIIDEVIFAFKKPKYKKYKHVEINGVLYKTSRPDLMDNLFKLFVDALTKAGVILDDSIIIRATNISKIYSDKDDYIKITIRGE